MSEREEDTSSRGEMTLDPAIAAKLKRDANGLFAAIAQERDTGKVLMLAWMDDEALARTLATREATYYSRSRGEHWVKGATSGHTQYVHSVRLDCDGDAVLLEVDQVGGACHTGFASCFYVELDKQGNDLPPQEEPLFNPDSVYKG
jgi:phosphoribosyl-AMP cyclohydrolase